jgi:hypothetical protein
MEKIMHVGQVLKYRGDSVKIVSVNDDGTVTLAHISGGKKKGFAGKIPAKVKTNGISPVPLKISETHYGDPAATISLEQYNTYTEPINYQAISQLDAMRRQYFSSATTSDIETINETLTNMRTLCSVVGANFQDVIEGRCGIDECQMQHRGGMAPNHYPSSGCKSGQLSHCTCDACF